ncbi:MAG: AMP-binding protein [Proteobacteria bacterium]|nr:AMP-binding protein [Pseudomonadota bacterium]
MTAIPHPIASADRQDPHRTAFFDSDGRPLATWREVREQVSRRAGSIADMDDIAAIDVGRGFDSVLDLFAATWAGVLATPTVEGPEAAARRAIADAELCTTSDGPALAEPMLRLEALLFRVLSSGSTGEPTPTDLSVAQLLFSAMGAMVRLGHDPEDRWLCCLPLMHIGGLSILMRAAWAGTSVELHPRFDVQAVAAATGRCTLLSLTAPMLSELLAAGAKPGKLRAVLVGGGPVSEDLRQAAWAAGFPVCTTWGMTESAAQLCTRAPHDQREGPDCGPPHVFARVRVQDERLVVDGPIVGTPLVTADRGRVDEDGRITVLGRSDLTILSGGANIDPVEIEERLEAHPSVREAAVVATPDPKWGERPVAFIVLERDVDDDALRSWCRTELKPYKTPDAFHRIGALPRSPLGKVRRTALSSQLGKLESRTAEAVEVVGRELRRPVGFRVEEDVNQANGGPKNPVVHADDGGLEGQGPRRALGNADLDPKALSHPHGALEIGFGVHERGDEASGREGLLDVTERGAEQLLVSDVRVVERTREEGDAGPVHIAKTNRHFGVEAHVSAPASSERAADVGRATHLHLNGDAQHSLEDFES